jgi:hypothetical protein
VRRLQASSNVVGPAHLVAQRQRQRQQAAQAARPGAIGSTRGEHAE